MEDHTTVQGLRAYHLFPSGSEKGSVRRCLCSCTHAFPTPPACQPRWGCLSVCPLSGAVGKIKVSAADLVCCGAVEAVAAVAVVLLPDLSVLPSPAGPDPVLPAWSACCSCWSRLVLLVSLSLAWHYCPLPYPLRLLVRLAGRAMGRLCLCGCQGGYTDHALTRGFLNGR